MNEFYAIHTEAMRRAGISPRGEQTYRDMSDELAPRGMARLLFAEIAATAAPVATLFLVSCGPRVVDLYGGTTKEGGDRRARASPVSSPASGAERSATSAPGTSRSTQ